MRIIWFLASVQCFEVTETIDFSESSITDVQQFLTNLGTANDPSSFSDYVVSVMSAYSSGTNAENNYLSLKFSKSDLDFIEDDAIQTVKDVMIKLRNTVIDELVAAQLSLVTDGSLNENEVRTSIEESSHLASAMPDEVVLSTCLELENGDKMQINTHCGNEYLATTITQCSDEDTLRHNSYTVTLDATSCSEDDVTCSIDDNSCSILVAGTGAVFQLDSDLAPGECGTTYSQANGLISIRNHIHVYQTDSIEEAITQEKGVIIGCDHSIIVGSIQGDGNFDASINTWSDNTYSTIHQSKVTRLGSPIYFSVESAYAINGVYYSINSCKFGTDTVDFEFLRQSGCRYGPLHVKAHDTFLTATGERQRFQYNAFVFRGHPYSGMKLTCEIEMCLQLSDTNTCPTQATGVCEDNFDNGTA